MQEYSGKVFNFLKKNREYAEWYNTTSKRRVEPVGSEPSVLKSQLEGVQVGVFLYMSAHLLFVCRPFSRPAVYYASQVLRQPFSTPFFLRRSFYAFLVDKVISSFFLTFTPCLNHSWEHVSIIASKNEKSENIENLAVFCCFDAPEGDWISQIEKKKYD